MIETNTAQPQKDRFVFYTALATILLVGAIVMVKLSENEKFAPIKEQLSEENHLMNIRVIAERED